MTHPTLLTPCIRQATPDDVLLLTHLLLDLSARTRYLRYFHPIPYALAQARAEANRMLTHAPHQAITLIATIAHGDQVEAVAVAELVCDPANAERGEVALLVRDDMQQRGLGRVLSQCVATHARSFGLTQVHADLLPENQAALRLLRHAGRPYTTTFVSGLVHAVLHLPEPNMHVSHAHTAAVQLH